MGTKQNTDASVKSHPVFRMAFARVHAALVAKAERKGRTRDEVDALIYWLTGYDDAGLHRQIEQEVDVETFFNQAPRMSPNCHLITGVVCGIRVEAIDDPLMQKIRWLDKLIDELAKGRPLAKIKRAPAL